MERRRGRKRQSLRKRFWAKVDKKDADQCWEWVGSKIPAGYGKIKINQKFQLAHRVSWVMHFGRIPKGDIYGTMSVCHKCDNKSCVNPNHLFLGNHQDNMDDMNKKGRSNYVRGESNGSAKLTQKEVSEILMSYPKQTQVQLAKRFGVTQPTVGAIVRRETWKHVAKHPPLTRKRHEN